MTETRIPPRALALLAVLTLVWGTNWPLLVYATREVSVWTFRAVATAGAGVVLLVVARLRGHSLALPREHLRTVVIAALAYLALWNVASTFAAILIPSGQAAVLGFTMPLWAAALSTLLLGQRLAPRLVAALGFGAAAVGLLMMGGLNEYRQAPLGFGLGLLAGLGWAVGTLLVKLRPVPVSTLVLTGWQLLVAAVPIALGAAVFGRSSAPSWTTVVVIAYITLVPMALGNAIWFAIVGMLPAPVAGLSSILVPMVAMISGALIHGEPLGPSEWGAMACSAAAMWLVVAPRR